MNRYDRKRAVTAKCDVIDNPDTDVIFDRLRNEILPSLGFRAVNGDAAMSFMDMAFIGTVGTPSEGLRAEFTGESEETAKNMNYLTASMLIAVVLIFAILVYQFGSFRRPAS